MLPYYTTDIIKKCDVALLDMFNDLRVNKYSDISRKAFTKTVKVPLTINQDKNFANWFRNTQVARQPMPLPIGALRFDNRQENSENRTQPYHLRSVYSKATEQWIRDVQPTPYYYFYTLEFLCDNRSDWSQLSEAILPYFNTTRTLRIREFDFAPDIERKIPVYLQGVTDVFEDELEAGSKHRLIKMTIKLRLDVDMYRPHEIAEIIKYAEMNIKTDDIIHTQQVFVYADAVAQREKKSWETISPSIRQGYSLLKSNARTLVRQVELDGQITYKEITPPDAIRPVTVPSFDLLHLNFDNDTPNELDQSGLGRDFVALNDNDRTYIPDFPPGAGQDTNEGYQLASTSSWNKILDWFGTNKGENESPFTFQAILQFKSNPPNDTIFQYLVNDQTLDIDGNTIPAGEVYFDWGLIDSQLYFTFKTYGDNALFFTYKTQDKLTLNNTEIYKFSFVLYEKGYSGMFAYTINNGPTIALPTIKE